MSIFDDGFDIEDATIIGGIMGYAEEAMREENVEPEEVTQEIDTSNVEVNDVNMRLLRNENPKFFSYIIKKVLEHKKAWAEYKLKRHQESMDASEVEHELKAMERSGIVEED